MQPKYVSDIIVSRRGGCRVWLEVEKADLIWLCIVENGNFRMIPFSTDGLRELESTIDYALFAIDGIESADPEPVTTAAAASTVPTANVDDIPF